MNTEKTGSMPKNLKGQINIKGNTKEVNNKVRLAILAVAITPIFLNRCLAGALLQEEEQAAAAA